MAGPQLEAWLAYKASKHAAPAVRDGLTVGALVGWLMGDALRADVRESLAGAARERVDALTLSALDVAAGEDAEGRPAEWEWVAAGATARTACVLIESGQALAKRQAAAVKAGEPSATDAFAAWRLALGLRAMHELWAPQFLEAGDDAPDPLGHPVGPLADAWIDANAPPAKVDRWPRATMPRLVTTERLGEMPTIEAPAIRAGGAPQIPPLGEIVPAAAPQLAYLPGLVPADATPRGVVPSSWLALMDGFSRTHSDPRVWQRALRLVIEVVSMPDPRERVGTVRVQLPVGGPDGIIRRLWPGDLRVSEHYGPLRGALERAMLAAVPLTGGPGVLLPIRLHPWQPRPDASLLFDVTYPRDGGNGATFDRAAFRRYGVQPHTFRVYLAAVWALDARQLRQRDGAAWLAALPLDALAALATYPDVPRDQKGRENARQSTRATLDRLARDGAIGGYDLAGRGARQRLALWRPRRELAAPAEDGGCG